MWNSMVVVLGFGCGGDWWFENWRLCSKTGKTDREGERERERVINGGKRGGEWVMAAEVRYDGERLMELTPLVCRFFFFSFSRVSFLFWICFLPLFLFGFYAMACLLFCITKLVVHGPWWWLNKKESGEEKIFE